jgi:hypothetical protein
MRYILPHILPPKHAARATDSQTHTYIYIKHFSMMLLCVLCLARPTTMIAQWEHMDRFFATNVISYATNDTRIVAMLLNGELYTSVLDSVDWKLMDVLPYTSHRILQTCILVPTHSLFKHRTDVLRIHEAQRNLISLSENLALRSLKR